MSAARARTRMYITRWRWHTARANSRANSGKREQWLRGALSPALRMAPVCITRQLATVSAHTIRRMTRDIFCQGKKRSAIRRPRGAGRRRQEGEAAHEGQQGDRPQIVSRLMHVHYPGGVNVSRNNENMARLSLLCLSNSQQRRPGRVPRFLGANRHRQYTAPLCLGVRDPGIAELRSIRVV